MAISSRLGRDILGEFPLGANISESYDRIISETNTISENIVRILTISRSISEIVNVQDVLSKLQTLQRNLSENITLSENLSRILIADIQIAESVDITDVVSRLAAYKRSLAETVSIIEELNRFKASAFRHFMQIMTNENDEDHFAAVCFNLQGMLHVQRKLK